MTLALLSSIWVGCSRPVDVPAPISALAPITRTEQGWVVESVVTGIAEMAAFASKREGTNWPIGKVSVVAMSVHEGKYQYGVTIGVTGQTQPLILSVPINN